MQFFRFDSSFGGGSIKMVCPFVGISAHVLDDAVDSTKCQLLFQVSSDRLSKIPKLAKIRNNTKAKQTIKLVSGQIQNNLKTKLGLLLSNW